MSVAHVKIRLVNNLEYLICPEENGESILQGNPILSQKLVSSSTIKKLLLTIVICLNFIQTPKNDIRYKIVIEETCEKKITEVG